MDTMLVVCPHCNNEVSLDWDTDVQFGRISLDWDTDIRLGRAVCPDCHQSIAVHELFAKKNGK